jgi:hypothetical protein
MMESELREIESELRKLWEQVNLTRAGFKLSLKLKERGDEDPADAKPR